MHFHEQHVFCLWKFCVGFRGLIGHQPEVRFISFGQSFLLACCQNLTNLVGIYLTRGSKLERDRNFQNNNE